MIKSDMGKVEIEGHKGMLATDFVCITKCLLEDDLFSIDEIERLIKDAQCSKEELLKDLKTKFDLLKELVSLFPPSLAEQISERRRSDILKHFDEMPCANCIKDCLEKKYIEKLRNKEISVMEYLEFVATGKVACNDHDSFGAIFGDILKD